MCQNTQTNEPISFSCCCTKDQNKKKTSFISRLIVIRDVLHNSKIERIKLHAGQATHTHTNNQQPSRWLKQKCQIQNGNCINSRSHSNSVCSSMGNLSWIL